MRDNKIVLEWIKKAEADLKNAEILLKEGGTIDAVCFHSQQAVEKYLKALLVFYKLTVKKIHSLVVLAKQASIKEPAILDFTDELKILDAYYIESRYPPEARVYSHNEGEKTLNLAKGISDYIKKLM